MDCRLWIQPLLVHAREVGLSSLTHHILREVHHRVTWTFCNILRPDFAVFIAGTALVQLSRQFRRWVSKLLFIPVTERPVKVKHALVQMALFDAVL